MERPTGVTVLAILCFIAAALCVLGGLAMFVGGSAISMMGGASNRGMMALLGGFGAALGAVFLCIAAVYAIAGYGLWALKNWGRILALVLVALGLISAAFGLMTSLVHFNIGLVLWRLIWIGIDVWIITYLLKPHVKQAFGTT